MGGGGLSFARKQDNNVVKNLNAKKLDIDFGSDDFFNQLQPTQAAANTNSDPFALFGNNLGQKSTKLQELPAEDPFAAMMGGSKKDSSSDKKDGLISFNLGESGSGANANSNNQNGYMSQMDAS